MNTIESRAKEGGRWNSTQISGELATEKSEKRRHLPALAPQMQQPDKDTLITSFSFFPWDLIMGRSLGGFSLLGGYAHIINTGETRQVNTGMESKMFETVASRFRAGFHKPWGETWKGTRVGNESKWMPHTLLQDNQTLWPLPANRKQTVVIKKVPL